LRVAIAILLGFVTDRRGANQGPLAALDSETVIFLARLGARP
jgi:hypothetical protein